MGILNKLKNALFEEVEIDLSETEDKVVIKDDPVPPVKEVKREEPDVSERELFKVEKTFDFPDFDEEEFVTNYENSKISEVEEKKETPKPKPAVFERKSRSGLEKTNKKEKLPEPLEPEKKVFKPSPVISPVYGVLDKNYKKEDFMTNTKPEPEKKKIDVDVVRKKAFGTLEDDIEKTLNESYSEFYNEETKSIDDLLKDTVDDTIEININDEAIESSESKEEFTSNIEEELENTAFNLEVAEDNSKNEDDEKYLEDNTLESDLFDLIDSMYDKREDDK